MADPLWSSGRTTIRHWGNAWNRAEKCVELAEHPALLEHVWVCHQDPLINCGLCPKCTRTRVALQLVGRDLPLQGPAVSRDATAHYLQLMRQGSEHVYVREFEALARSVGNTRVADLLAKGGRRLQRRVLLRTLRNAGFPGAFQARIVGTDLQPWGRGPGLDTD